MGFGVDNLFRNDFRLSRLIPCSRGIKQLVSISPKNAAGDCNIGVVYERPVACGHVDIRQTGRCFKDDVTELKRSVKMRQQAHFCHVRDRAK